MNQPAPIGHNNPPSGTEQERINERLTETYVDLDTRFKELGDALQRVPAECPDDDTAQKLTSFGNQLKGLADTLEDRRKLEKKPYDEAASAVHQFFKNRIDVLDGGIRVVKATLKKYLDAKAEKARQAEIERQRVAREAEEKARAEAAALLEQAAKQDAAGLAQTATQTLEAAGAAEQQATVAAAAQAPVKAAPAIIRGTIGGSSGRQGRWKFEVTDAKEIDLEALRPYFDLEALTKAGNKLMKVSTGQLKDGEEPVQIKGAKIFRDSSVTFRG